MQRRAHLPDGGELARVRRRPLPRHQEVRRGPLRVRRRRYVHSCFKACVMFSNFILLISYVFSTNLNLDRFLSRTDAESDGDGANSVSATTSEPLPPWLQVSRRLIPHWGCIFTMTQFEDILDYKSCTIQGGPVLKNYGYRSGLATWCLAAASLHHGDWSIGLSPGKIF